MFHKLQAKHKHYRLDIGRYENIFAVPVLSICSVNRLVFFLKLTYWNRNMIQYCPIYACQYLEVKEVRNDVSGK